MLSLTSSNSTGSGFLTNCKMYTQGRDLETTILNSGIAKKVLKVENFKNFLVIDCNLQTINQFYRYKSVQYVLNMNDNSHYFLLV